MKKLILLGLCILILSSFVSGATTLFSDDFNRADSNTVGNGWIETEASATDVKILSNELYTTRVSSPGIAEQDISSYTTEELNFNFDVKTTQVSSQSANFHILNDLKTSTISYVYFYQGQVWCQESGTGTRRAGTATVSANTWYNVNLTNYDWSGNTYDIYLDGVYVDTCNFDSAGSYSQTDIGYLKLWNSFTGAITYFDNVIIYDTTETGIPQIEFTAKNNYTGDAITNFNLNLTNSSGTYSLSTTNGSIFSYEDGNIDATFYSSEYHARTYTSWDSTTDLEGDIGETNVNLVIKDELGNPIGENFQWTITDYSNTTNITFNTNTGNFSSSPPSELVNYHVIDNSSAFYPAYPNITFPTLATGEYNLTVEYKPIELTFVEQSTSNPIENANITVYFPEGESNIYTTNASGVIEVPIIYNSKLQLGSYTFSFGAYGGYESPVNFTRNITAANLPYSEELDIVEAGIFVRVFDRETGSLLTGVPVDITILGVLNQTTDTGLVNIVTTLIAGEYTIQGRADGYITEQSLVTYTGQANATLDLYLLNSTGTNTALLYVNVIDDFYRTQPNARVSLYQYDETTLGYTKVSEVLSNANGESIFGIELNVKTYKLTATKTINNNVYSVETTPEIIKTADEVRQLILRYIETFDLITTDKIKLDYSETFVNNISTVYMAYETTDNFIAQMCVGYFLKQYSGDSNIYEQCVNASGAYSAIPVLLNRSNNYYAQIYYKDNTDKIVFVTYNYPSINSLDSLFVYDNIGGSIFVWVWIMLIVIALATKSIPLFSYLGVLIVWVQFFNFPSTSLLTASGLKTVILILLLQISRKKEDDR